MEALLPVLSAIFPAVEFEGLTLIQWGEIVAALAAAKPEIESLAVKLGPAIQKFLGQLKNKQTGQPLMSGYGADGSVRQIPSEMSGVR
jgi:hypothetical protein